MPVKDTYCPLLFFKYAGSMSYFICDGFGFHVTRSPCVDFLCPYMKHVGVLIILVVYF